MGLQRECSGWGFSPEEVQRRRTVFWELFVFETWTSLLSGRPSLLNLRQINCRFPEDREPVTYQGEVEIGCRLRLAASSSVVLNTFPVHSWLFRFAAGCMSLAVQHVFSSRKPTYAMLTELDTKIRRFPVPRYLRCPMESISTPWSDDPAIAMQQFCAYGHVEHSMSHSAIVMVILAETRTSDFVSASLPFCPDPRRADAGDRRALSMVDISQ